MADRWECDAAEVPEQRDPEETLTKSEIGFASRVVSHA